jgi:hypothetical protein
MKETVDVTEVEIYNNLVNVSRKNREYSQQSLDAMGLIIFKPV